MYLFLGEEEGEKDKIISRIISAIFKDDEDRRNSVGRFYVEDLDGFLSAAGHAVSPSMFSANLVTIIRNVDNIKSSKLSKDAAGDLIRNLPSSTTLIMTSEKYQPPAIFGAEELKLIKVVKFWKFFANELAGYASEFLGRFGISADQRALDRILEISGRDIRRLDEILEKLRYSGIRGLATPEMISGLIHDNAETTIFEFIDLLFTGDTSALEGLQRVLNGGIHELVILSNITRQAEMIEKYHWLVKSGMPGDKAAGECGVFDKNKDLFFKMACKFPEERIRKIFPLISRTDLELKSGGQKKSLLSNPVFILAGEILFSI